MLQQPRLLADEFYLVAHHDVTGRPRQHPRALGLGLGAALLAELVLSGHATVSGDLLVVVSRRPPADALAHTVLDQLAGERHQHAVRTWLAYLGRDALDRVAGRLERDGVLRRQEPRWRLRGEPRWVPTDMSAAAWPGMRLRLLLERLQPLELADVVLAGLVDAAGLTPDVLWGVGPRTFEYRDYVLTALPELLRALLAQTKAAVGSAVLAHRG